MVPAATSARSLVTMVRSACRPVLVPAGLFAFLLVVTRFRSRPDVWHGTDIPSLPPHTLAALVSDEDASVHSALPGHESFDYAAFVDRLFTPDQIEWLDRYRPHSDERHTSSDGGRSQAVQAPPLTPHAPIDAGVQQSQARGRPSPQVENLAHRQRHKRSHILAALQQRTKAWRDAEGAREQQQPTSSIAPGEALRLKPHVSMGGGGDGSHIIERVALRTSQGTYLSASMDRQRLVQAAIVSLTELFSEVAAGSGRNASVASRVALRSHYGTCVGAPPGEQQPLQAACSTRDAWITLVPLAHGRVALRTSSGAYLSPSSDARRIVLSKLQGTREAFEVVSVRTPERQSPRALGSGGTDDAMASGVMADSVLRVSGAWEPRGAWCIEWRAAVPLSMVDATTRLAAHLRLCFNASSGTQYWQERGNSAPLTGLPVEPQRQWQRFGERPLTLMADTPFMLEVRTSSGLVTYATGGGGWQCALSNVSRLQLLVSTIDLVSYGSKLSAVRMWQDDDAHGETSRRLRLLPPFELGAAAEGVEPASRTAVGSGAALPAAIVGAPREYHPAASLAVQPAHADAGGAVSTLHHGTFRLYNPSIAWRVRGEGGSDDGPGVLRVVAKVSSYSLCGLSDEYDAVAAERSGALLSFLVRFDVSEGSGRLVGPIRAMESVNTALTRHVAYGDGPEDPRAVRLGGRTIVLLWARTETPEYSMYAAVHPAADGAGERAVRVIRLRQSGCEGCKQKNWAPLVHRGKLYAEAAIEPRSVLRIDLQTGIASPSAPELTSTSFAPAAELQRTVGATLHGGPPAVRIAMRNGTRAYLGLAHFNRLLPGRKPLRLYFHVFYLFAPRPPFQLLALGPPFMFPSEAGMVQFASGMLLSADGHKLVISFGEQDCEARRATLPLAAALADTRATG